MIKQNFKILISIFFMLHFATNLQAAQAQQVRRIVEVVKVLPKGGAAHQQPPAPKMAVAQQVAPKRPQSPQPPDPDAVRQNFDQLWAQEQRRLEDLRRAQRAVEEEEKLARNQVIDALSLDREKIRRIMAQEQRRLEDLRRAQRAAEEAARLARRAREEEERELAAALRFSEQEALRVAAELEEAEAIRRLEAEIADVECPICLTSLKDLEAPNAMMRTTCGHPICHTDFVEMQREAQAMYHNVRDRNWLDAQFDAGNTQYIGQQDKYLGYPICPICRFGQDPAQGRWEIVGPYLFAKAQPKKAKAPKRN